MRTRTLVLIPFVAAAVVCLLIAATFAATRPDADVDRDAGCMALPPVHAALQDVVDATGGFILIARGADAQRFADRLRGYFGVRPVPVSAVIALVHTPVTLAMFGPDGCLFSSSLVRADVFFAALKPP